MTRQQWGWAIILMIFFFAPLFEISKYICWYMANMEFSWKFVAEMTVYWLIWLSVIPIMWRASKS